MTNNCKLARIWCTKTDQIIHAPQMSTAKKILAYKIFLRPMLIYDWFEGHNDKVKSLEVQFLRRVFGASSITRLYNKYTDIDVTKYMRLQEIRWRRATGSNIRNLRKMLHGLLESNDDISLYFTTAKNNLSQCRCDSKSSNEATGPDPRRKSATNVVENHECTNGRSATASGNRRIDMLGNHRQRRSTRLANRNNFSSNRRCRRSTT